MAHKGFTGRQKQYLEGLASGLRLAQRAAPLPHRGPRARADETLVEPARGGVASAVGADVPFHEAQDRFVHAGQRLSAEEKAKRHSSPEDLWERMAQLARERRFPQAEEVFLFKYHGLRIHVSGCHHACAQHTIADIGLLALRGHSDASDERYQLWFGGQVSKDARLGREFATNVPAADVARVVEDVVETYLERRLPREKFSEFVARIEPPDLRRWAAQRTNRLGGVA